MVREERLNSFMTDVLIIKKTIWQSKSMDWFLYERDLRHERVNASLLVCIHREIYSLIMRQNIQIFSSEYPRRMLLINPLSEN